MITSVDVEWLYSAPGELAPLRQVKITMEGGRITDIAPLQQACHNGKIALPALVNAHDHGRGLRPAAFGAADQELEAWVGALGLLPQADLYTMCVVAFGRLALSGVASISHVHLPNGGDMVEEAKIVARAAADVGVRVAFAVPIVDVNAFVYGGEKRFCSCHTVDDWSIIRHWDGRAESAIQQIDRLADVVSACETEMFHIQYGPAGPQWVSEAGLKHLGASAAYDGRRVHMHLLETVAQRQWSDAHYPQGLLNWLDDAGLLSPALSLAHCVWLRDEEIDLLAARGVTAIINSSSNLRLSSGMAPVRRFYQRGLSFAFGLDGLAFNDDEDALFELRLLASLHGRRGFEEGGVDRATVWRAATSNGRLTIDGKADAGRLEVGQDADIMVLNMHALAADGLVEMCDPLDLVMTRGARRHVCDVFVAGCPIVAQGKLVGVDLAAAESNLLEEARKSSPAKLAQKPLMDRHLAAMTHYYRSKKHLKGRD